MKLENIKFNDKEELLAVSVNMTIEEACWMAKMCGRINNVSSSLHSDIYSCLAGALFNKFYEDGIDEAQKELGVKMPNIQDITENK